MTIEEYDEDMFKIDGKWYLPLPKSIMEELKEMHSNNYSEAIKS